MPGVSALDGRNGRPLAERLPGVEACADAGVVGAGGPTTDSRDAASSDPDADTVSRTIGCEVVDFSAGPGGDSAISPDPGTDGWLCGVKTALGTSGRGLRGADWRVPAATSVDRIAGRSAIGCGGSGGAGDGCRLTIGVSVLESDEPASTVGVNEPREAGVVADEARAEGGWWATAGGCKLPVDRNSTAGPAGSTAAVAAVGGGTGALRSVDSVSEISDALLSADSVDEVSDT